MAGKSFTVNEVVIEGKLARDPEIRFTGNGLAIANFAIATDDGTQERPKTNFHTVKAFGALAEGIAEQMSKGETVLVCGRLDNEKWEDKKSGEERTKTVVICNSAYKKVWGKRAPAQEQPPARSRRPACERDDTGDEEESVPF